MKYTYEEILSEEKPELRAANQIVRIPLSKDIRDVMDGMIEYVRQSQDSVAAEEHKLRPAVGIAAPQVGANVKMVFIRVATDEGYMEHAMINPVITKVSAIKAFLSGGEGCLSVKREVEGYVERYAAIEVSFVDYPTLKKKKVQLAGFPAIVAQHEIDHLDGVLFIDKILDEPPLDAQAI